MDLRTCHHCGKDYQTWKGDALVATNALSPWLENVCKRCTCRLRKYHTWTIDDDGRVLCGYCFVPRIPIAILVRLAAKRRKT